MLPVYPPRPLSQPGSAFLNGLHYKSPHEPPQGRTLLSRMSRQLFYEPFGPHGLAQRLHDGDMFVILAPFDELQHGRDKEIDVGGVSVVRNAEDFVAFQVGLRASSEGASSTIAEERMGM